MSYEDTDPAQFTVETPGNALNYFVLAHPCRELTEFLDWCTKSGVVCRPSTAQEIAWFDDPEFKMDGENTDEPCFDFPQEEAELRMSIKDW